MADTYTFINYAFVSDIPWFGTTTKTTNVNVIVGSGPFYS